MNHSRSTSNKLWSKSYGFSKQSKTMCKCGRGASQQFECVAYSKNNVEWNDFKQFAMWNGLSRRNKFPDKMKNSTCFQKIKFCIAFAKYRDLFHITSTNIGTKGPFFKTTCCSLRMKHHKLCDVLGQLSTISFRAPKSNTQAPREGWGPCAAPGPKRVQGAMDSKVQTWNGQKLCTKLLLL